MTGGATRSGRPLFESHPLSSREWTVVFRAFGTWAHEAHQPATEALSSLPRSLRELRVPNRVPST